MSHLNSKNEIFFVRFQVLWKKQKKVQGHHVIHYIFRFDKQVGKAEFLGRAIGKPNAILFEENYKAPSLEWFQIHRGSEDAGELLAAFEMFEVSFS